MGVVTQAATGSYEQVEFGPLRAAFDATAESLLLVENARILFANPACAKLLGYENSAGLLGQPVSAVFPQTRFCHDLFQAPENLQCEHPSCELSLRGADGCPVQAQAHCTRFCYGNHVLVLVALRELKRVELGRLVHDSKLRFRTVFEGAAIGIATCMLDGRIIECNPAVSKMLGYSQEELAGMHPRELHPGDFEPDAAFLAELAQGKRDSFTLEKYFRRKDGSQMLGQLTVSAVRNSDGKPAFLVAMLEDTTERKRIEEQLREAEKMEVIGRLAGGIAHDFNNLLTGVLLYCDLLAAGLEPDDRLSQYVEEIRMAGEQGAALTRQLLAIARKQAPLPRPVLLNDVVSSMQNLLRRLIGEQIDLVADLAPQLGTVMADMVQLRQVLLNLVLNARDAMPQGGRITVSTRAGNLPGSGAPAVSLLVADTGCGMDAPTRARLFEPFFTTKQAGHGTGLGLATVQRIVRESGGTIEVRSEPGCGTRVEVFLPVTQASAAASQPATRRHTGGTILLVDDDASERNSVERVLSAAGFSVLPATNSEQALRIFAEKPDSIDILVADGAIPEVNGRELAEKLRQRKPGLNVLLISECPDTQSESEAASVARIRKPFAGSALIERVREVLDSKGERPC